MILYVGVEHDAGKLGEGGEDKESILVFISAPFRRTSCISTLFRLL